MPDKKAEASEKQERRPPVALLLELESVVVGGRRLLYQIVKEELEDKNFKLSAAVFSRCGVGKPIKSLVTALAALGDKSKAQPEKAAERVAKRYRDALLDASTKPNSHAAALLQRAAAAQVSLGVLTGLDKAAAEGWLSARGLPAAQVMTCGTGPRAYPTVDAWMKMSKTLRARPAACVAMASSAMACKEALAAGMHCIAIPDEFTSFQDFGGVDFVTDPLNDEAVERTLRLLEQQP